MQQLGTVSNPCRGAARALTLLLSLALCTGCSESGSDSCPAGQLQCACGAGDACDGELVCREGFCVPAAGAGAVGDPCSDDAPCGLADDGTQLSCTAGVCRLPGCDAGTLGCDCAPGKSCGDGLVCVGSVCLAATAQGVTVGNPDVRACDVLLEAPGAAVAFGDAVEGVSLSEGDKLAFSFTARVDATLDGPVAELLVPGGGGAALTPARVECWDRRGAAVAEPQLSFQ